MTTVPAVLLSRRNDVLAWNRMAHRLLAGHYDFHAPQRPQDRPNLTWMLFLDPHTRELFRHWQEEAARARWRRCAWWPVVTPTTRALPP